MPRARAAQAEDAARAGAKRVLATDDERLLQRWFDRALVAGSVEEVFEPLDA